MTTLSMGTRTWSQNTHEKPYFPVAGGLVSKDHRLFLQKTEQRREGRRLLHQLMTGECSKLHSSLAEESSLELLKTYLDEPNAWYAHNYRSAISIMYRIVTRELEDLQRVTSTFLTSIKSSFVDFYPQISLLPKHWWSELKGSQIPESSFIRKTMLGEYKGSDNPQMTMNKPIRRMRLELDSICGADAYRLPCTNDLASAPYSSAVVEERVLVEDLELEGYKFPRGTEFLVNTIAVCANGFDKADKGKQDNSRSNSGVEQNLWQFAFNAGRRSCVGYKLAQKELFIAFSRLAYCFDFSPVGEFNDKELNAFAPGQPFPVRITVKSPTHERLIRTEAAKCDIWGS
ncbi:cytochrome protein [Xylaria flabelliformis]|nr:cytochrome protein [Xylaria flabelliformis]